MGVLSRGVYFLLILVITSCYVGYELNDVKALGELRLTIAYCPTIATGEGAIVTVDPTTGSWTIDSTFKWPGDIFACPLLDDPAVYFDTPSSNLYLDTDDGTLIILNLITHDISVVHPNNLFFTGYINLFTDGTYVKGITGTVESTGYCFDGCFALGQLETPGGQYKKIQDIPFKAILDDSHYFDSTSNTLWVQGSYDLREKTCAPADDDECLLQINADTGDLISALWTNYTVYKFAQPSSDGTILSWTLGFTELCKHPYNDFLFTMVNLTDATAVPIACIPKDVTVDMDEWIASFSLDSSIMATGSGDAETGAPQLLVFNTATGGVVLNTNLTGLAEALKTYDNLFDIWSVDFVNT